MPYSDPERKKEYMKKYNPLYYKGNTNRIITKNTKRKADLRKKKKDYLLSSVDNSCPHCLSQEELLIRYAMDSNLYDLSWSQVKLALMNNLIDIRCKTCKKQGAPEENH
jgi:hypothetical protein